MLDTDEQRHAGNIKSTLQKYRYIETHARLRLLLAQYLSQAPETIVIRKAEFGKPYLENASGLVFNLSHSGPFFLIAVGQQCQLGVDVETVRHRSSFSALINKCFAEEEKAYWQRQPESLQAAAFYRIWTRKEAFVKAVGRGLALGLKQCVVYPGNLSEFLRIPGDCGSISNWQSFELDLGSDLFGALVVDNTNIPRIQLKEL